MVEEKQPAGAVKTFACPSCGGTVVIRAVGTSITAVCQSCGSLIDVANDNFRIIKEAASRIRTSTIPLGARGTIGVEWEVIGYSELSDESNEYWWQEYLLFNPYQGFRFLVEADGHWNFVKMVRKDVGAGITMNHLRYSDTDYRVYDRGSAVVHYVMGEFYWRVKVGDVSEIADFIAPPYMLSVEKSGEDIVWSQGVYIDSEEIRAAFNIESGMPIPKDVAPNQPAPYDGKGFKKLAIILCLALCVIQFIAVSHAANRTVYHRTVQATPNYKGQLLLSDPVDIPYDIGNVEIWAHSPVSNDWVELDISLVSDTTQESDDIIMPIEYYFGYDSDGSWREGSQTTISLLSAVRGGAYHFLVEPDAGAFFGNRPVDLDLYIVRDVPMWENFWVALCALLAYPLWVMMRSRYFETRRWANSDYAPATYRKE